MQQMITKTPTAKKDKSSTPPPPQNKILKATKK